MSVLDKLLGNLSKSLSPSVGIGGGAITVSDGTDDPAGPFRALWVGSSGNVKITCLDDSVITLPNVPVGLLSMGAKRIWSTGTTVATPNTNIVGVY